MRRRALILSVLALSAATATIAPAQNPKFIEDPFKPAPSAGGAAPTAHETIEFAGVSQLGKTTHLIFLDKVAKKSRWVKEGETVEGISVLKYDPRLEQVVVKINGAEKTLSLRKGAGTTHAPGLSVVPLPPAAGFNIAPPPGPQMPQIAQAPVLNPIDPAVQVGTPAPAPAQATEPAAPQTAQAKAETEARMLVSDLLEIGMAQRKAYEEAQRKQAPGNEQTPPPQAPK
ncbi:MAG: hypothetical protein V4773_17245 [Verrucomicrobiota bacterium]